MRVVYMHALRQTHTHAHAHTRNTHLKIITEMNVIVLTVLRAELSLSACYS